MYLTFLVPIVLSVSTRTSMTSTFPFLFFKEKIVVVIDTKVECIACLATVTNIGDYNNIRIASREGWGFRSVVKCLLGSVLSSEEKKKKKRLKE